MSQFDRSLDQFNVYGSLASTASLRRLLRPGLLVGVAALVLSLYGAFLHREQFWHSYLLAYIFWLEIGLGCLGIVMLHHLVGGRWSALIRHLMETGAMTLPLMALFFLPLVLGFTTLYPWTDPQHVLDSVGLQNKAIYLNVPFFLIRTGFYFVVWLALATLLHRRSQALGRTGDPSHATWMRRASALGMILYVLTATFAAYDWLMSLEPEWYSSIYGLLFIAGQALAAIALAIIGLGFLAKSNPDGDAWTGQFNDLGNLMLGFVMIWAYFAFSQFLVIWSANIPEEAIWYVHRTQGGWQNVGMFVLAFHFALPFLLLLSRTVKRKVRWLTILAVLMFAVRWVDLYWLIMPAFYPEGIHVHWLDLALLIAIGGFWAALFIRQWTGRSLLPAHDPRL